MDIDVSMGTRTGQVRSGQAKHIGFGTRAKGQQKHDGGG